MEGLFGKMSSSAVAIAARLSPRKFARREDGTVTAFAAMMFVLMVGASGIAIDVMRYETQRAQMQYTLDRAVLAAASLTQPYDPEGVVRNYFEVSGIEDYRLDVRVDQGLNFRRVHAYAELEVRSLFMQLFGVRVMSSPAFGAAEERVRNIEVSMVLDVSGSMDENNRLPNMQTGAREFITEVLSPNYNPTNEQLVSVSVVPYAEFVNVGSILASTFTFDSTHSESTCVHFDDADYADTAVSPFVTLRRVAHFDWVYEWTDTTFQEPYCPTDDTNAILPWSHVESTIHGHIDSLTAGGNTQIDDGLRWGLALLDPTAQPAVSNLVTSNAIHGDFLERPAPFIDGDPTTSVDDDTIKVLVLMTDGENTEQWDLRDEYRSGYSPIFYHNDDDRYSVYYEDVGAWWIPNGADPRGAYGSFQTQPYGGWAAYNMTQADFDTDGPNGFTPGGGGAGIALAWSDLFASYTARYIANEWFRRPALSSGFTEYYDRLAGAAAILANDADAADANARQLCNVAHGEGVIIFSIGFEATEGGQALMRDCASSQAHYYEVYGTEITEAFASIARTINQLRLIQ